MTAKKIALNGDAVAHAPFIDIAAELADHSGNLGPGNAWELQRDGQAAFFEPKIEPIQAAGADFDDDFVVAGLQRRNVREPKLARAAVSDQLEGSHASIETHWP